MAKKRARKSPAAVLGAKGGKAAAAKMTAEERVARARKASAKALEVRMANIAKRDNG